jgi:uncharacterized protein YerC
MTSHRVRPVLLIADDQQVVPAYQVAAYLNEGHTLREAGDEFGVSASTICRFMEKTGYRPRRPSRWEKS